MSELKAYSGEDIQDLIDNGDKIDLEYLNKQFVEKSEADAVIAEKDAENRRLRRALWLSRLQSLRNFSVLAYFQMIRAKGKESSMDFNEMAYRIDLARVKCRAKAEEFKETNK